MLYILKLNIINIQLKLTDTNDPIFTIFVDTVTIFVKNFNPFEIEHLSTNFRITNNRII